MAAEMFVQLSLLSFYLRIFSSPVFRRMVWALMALVVCFGITNTFTMIFQCTPVAFFWVGWAGETTGTCININLFSWIRAAVEIAIDVAIITLPIPTVLKLQMSWRRRIQVVLVFCIGFLITLISILRLQSLVQFSKTQNPTYDNAPAVFWSVLECDMFIICACMPSMRSFLRMLAPSCFQSTVGSRPSENTDRTGRTRISSGENYRREPSVKENESDVELVEPHLDDTPRRVWRKV